MSLKNIHLNILTSPQHDLLPLVSRFKRSFYLVGGTAISLQIGHRRSIDFDLFTGASFSKFSEKLFREQLCYHADIDYTETVDYIEQPVEDDEVRSGLIDLAAGIL